MSEKLMRSAHAHGFRDSLSSAVSWKFSSGMLPEL